MGEGRPARSTLEGVPERVSRFLSGLAFNAHARAALAIEGYEQADHDEGWRLFHAVSGYTPEPAAAVVRNAALAMFELDKLDAGLFDKVDATLEHRFPGAREVVLGGLAAGERTVAVSNVKSIVERIAKLRSAGGNDEVLARLAKVKLDAAELERLAALVAQAGSFEGTSGASESDQATGSGSSRATSRSTNGSRSVESRGGTGHQAPRLAHVVGTGEAPHQGQRRSGAERLTPMPCRIASAASRPRPAPSARVCKHVALRGRRRWHRVTSLGCGPATSPTRHPGPCVRPASSRYRVGHPIRGAVFVASPT